MKHYRLLAITLSLFLIHSVVIAEEETTFYILRHGQTDWNKEKRVQGRTDTSLNDQGRLEAALIAQQLSDQHFDVCYSSPLKRALETATIIILPHQLNILTDERLLERNYGHWEGRFKREFELADVEEKYDVETNSSIQERVFPFLEELLLRHPGQKILIVAHAGVIRNIVGKISHSDSIESIEIPNCTLIQFRKTNDSWTLEEREMQEIQVTH